MARVTSDDLRPRRPVIDRERMAAATEDDIRRHALEDGGDVDLPAGVLVSPAMRPHLSHNLHAPPPTPLTAR